MLGLSEINRIARLVVESHLSRAGVSSVEAEPYQDWAGDEALSVRVVFRTDPPPGVLEGATIRVLLGMGEALRARDEHRFPHIRYATEHDLSHDADAEE